MKTNDAIFSAVRGADARGFMYFCTISAFAFAPRMEQVVSPKDKYESEARLILLQSLYRDIKFESQ